MAHTPECCLCNQIEGNRDNDLIASLLPEMLYVRRVIAELDSFALIPSLGPLTEGHVLLCPTTHYKSFAELPEDNNSLVLRLKAAVTRILTQAYGLPVHIFEHGMAAKGGRLLCSVEHAHLHFVPADVSIERTLLTGELEWRSTGISLPDLRAHCRDLEYIYYESPSGTSLVASDVAGSVESQYMRRVFSSALGRECDWNWREHPKPRTADATFRRLLEVVS